MKRTIQLSRVPIFFYLLIFLASFDPPNPLRILESGPLELGKESYVGCLLYNCGNKIINDSQRKSSATMYVAARNPPQPSRQPTVYPTSRPTGRPTAYPSNFFDPTPLPSSLPSSSPSGQPSGQPSRQPYNRPTGQPSRQPTSRPSSPSGQPTSGPSYQPSSQPTGEPSPQPTGQPTSAPNKPVTSIPTAKPTATPTPGPTLPPVQDTITDDFIVKRPSPLPSRRPTSPTLNPTPLPSRNPTRRPTYTPTRTPTWKPSVPTSQPTRQPSRQPSRQPTRQPSRQPSSQPTTSPSRKITPKPTMKVPTGQPTRQPSSRPSQIPTTRPTYIPTISKSPTVPPSGQPTGLPTGFPTSRPTSRPSAPNRLTNKPSAPSGQPSSRPSKQPSSQPSRRPSRQPSSHPTGQPSRQPSSHPTQWPSAQPTGQPSFQPTGKPSSSKPSYEPGAPTPDPTTASPSSQPSGEPSSQPTGRPSIQPTSQPSSQPSGRPTSRPTAIPTSRPTISPYPTGQPTRQPSMQPSSRPTWKTGETARPTNRFQNLNASTGTVYVNPDDARACSNVSIIINLYIHNAFMSGDTIVINTPGITSGPCTESVNGDNLRGLLINSNMSTPGNVFTGTYFEGNYSNAFRDSYIALTLFGTLVSGHHSIHVDRLNGLRRSCLSDNTWEVTGVKSGFTNFLTFGPNPAYSLGALDLVTLNSYQNCHVYQSQLSFFPPEPHMQIGINLTLQLTFDVNDGDQFVIELPGFSGTRADYEDNHLLPFTSSPTQQPTYDILSPTPLPTAIPTTFIPSGAPTPRPSGEPIPWPTKSPVVGGTPRSDPTVRPTPRPSPRPSFSPTEYKFPNANFPTRYPTALPTGYDRPLDTLLSVSSSTTTQFRSINGISFGWNGTWHEGSRLTADSTHGSDVFSGGLGLGNHTYYMHTRVAIMSQGRIPAGTTFWLSIDRFPNHIVAYCGSRANHPGYKISFQSGMTGMTLNKTSIMTSNPIGPGCSNLNYCNGNGQCDFCSQTCRCFDGAGSPRDRAVAVSLDFQPDCSSKTCPVGPSRGSMPMSSPHYPWQASSNMVTDYHRLVECSGAGTCDRRTGLCKCFDGYEGPACNRLTSTCVGNSKEGQGQGQGEGGGGGWGGGGDTSSFTFEASGAPVFRNVGPPKCSGRGMCYPIEYLSYQEEATPLQLPSNSYFYRNNYKTPVYQQSSWDAMYSHACVCDSSWPVGLGANETQQAEYFGPTCEYKHCPTGDDPMTTIDETNCTAKSVFRDGGNLAGLGLYGNKCHVDCSNRGICDYSTGTCTCFQDFYGSNCALRRADLDALTRPGDYYQSV